MSSLSARSYIIVFAGFVAFFVSAFADARLIRGAGRGVGTDSFNETTELVNASGVNVIGLEPGTGNFGSYSYNSFHQLVYSTPAQECWFNTFAVDPNPELIRTDCDWEFVQGERLQLEGFVEIFLANSASFEAVWVISQGTNVWQFAGPGVTVEDNGGGLASRVFLDVAMPTDLGAGDYLVSLTFTQLAPQGQTFFTYSDINDPVICADIGDPAVEVCGQTGSSTTELVRASVLEDLRIIAQVPEPASVILLSIGLFALARRRKQS